VGDEWFDLSKVSKRWTDKTIQTNKTRLDYAKHGFGDKEIAKVTAEDVLRVCRKLEKKGSIDTAKRTRGVISQILRYSMLYDVTEQVKGALLTRESVNHPHLTDKKDIAELMTRLKNYHGSFETKQALLFVVYTFVRQKCWRLAEWKEIDGDMWRVPSNHMKNDKDFLVPLSRQALEIISTMKELNGDNRYIFSYAHKPDQALSVSTLSRVLSRMGYKDKQTPHGFRHVASTWLNELQYDAGAIELQLAHITKGVAGVYNKAEKIDYRKKMMQDWADWLDSL
jgi:integrase